MIVESWSTVFVAQVTLTDRAKLLEDIFAFFNNDQIISETIGLIRFHLPPSVIRPTELNKIGYIWNALLLKQNENFSWLIKVYRKLMRFNSNSPN